VGTAAVDAYDASVAPELRLRRLLPEAKTAIVIGNGGGAFWAAFRDHCHAHPEHEQEPDPVDAFTRRAIEAAIATSTDTGGPTRLLYPFRYPTDPVSFMRLAECAGLGRPSLVGVLVHPVFGPWIALRAALLVPLTLAAPRPAEGFDPCPGCTERACVDACPAGAVTAAGWDVPRCAAHRLQPEDPCALRCHARFDCVIGRAHRYPAEALGYHQGRARAALAPYARPRP
jgi:hypothetical protein